MIVVAGYAGIGRIEPERATVLHYDQLVKVDHTDGRVPPHNHGLATQTMKVEPGKPTKVTACMVPVANYSSRMITGPVDPNPARRPC